MAGWPRIAGFAVVVALAFALALGVGRWVGPIEGDGGDDHAHDAARGEAGRTVLSPAGSTAGSGDVSLDLARSVYDAGRQRLAFTLRDAEGEPVTDYEVVHEKRLHLVVVRRDLGGYRHVHPTLDPATGEWSTPLDLDAGAWRVYADFTPAGGDASLAEADLSVGGDFAPSELGADRVTDRVDGFEVHLAREGTELALHVTRDGADVTDLQPYLGAYGHLVAIRADDLAYLHVHPKDGPPGPEVAFHASLAEGSRYRLFFEFRHGGVVRRAEFTLSAGGVAPAAGGGSDEHAH